MIGKSQPALLLLVVAFSGCGSTQFAPANRSLLEKLQTAVSAKDPQWLDGVAKQIDEQRTKSAISDAEYKALSSILSNAKAGQWDAAQKQVFALSEAQRPTADDLARLREHKTSTRKK